MHSECHTSVRSSGRLKSWKSWRLEDAVQSARREMKRLPDNRVPGSTPDSHGGRTEFSALTTCVNISALMMAPLIGVHGDDHEVEGLRRPLAAEEDVGDDVEVGRQRQVLVDHLGGVSPASPSTSAAPSVRSAPRSASLSVLPFGRILLPSCGRWPWSQPGAWSRRWEGSGSFASRRAVTKPSSSVFAPAFLTRPWRQSRRASRFRKTRS